MLTKHELKHNNKIVIIIMKIIIIIIIIIIIMIIIIIIIITTFIMDGLIDYKPSSHSTIHPSIHHLTY